MSDLIRGLAGVTPRKNQTQYMRRSGDPVHFTDGTVMSEADADFYQPYGSSGVQNAAEGIQPPDLSPPVRPVQPNPYANMPVNQGQPPSVGQQNAWGQENYGHMMAQRRAAYEAGMARRGGGG
jgi:hypothetical protein